MEEIKKISYDTCHRQKLVLSYHILFMSPDSYYAVSNLPSLHAGLWYYY